MYVIFYQSTVYREHFTNGSVVLEVPDL